MGVSKMGRITLLGNLIPFYFLKKWVLRNEQVWTGAVFETPNSWRESPPNREPVSYMVIDNGVYLVIDSKRMLESKRQKLQSDIDSINERLSCVAKEESPYEDD